MLLKHFFLEKIAHSSYLLAGKETCAVIDPRRDVDIYIDEARALGLEITHVVQTHLHADFVSGHMDLAAQTGAKIIVSKSARCEFEHVPVKEGDTIAIEKMELKVIETPGHTPEHLSFVVTDGSRGDTPIGVFTGDTLFVGDVGRPDLFPGEAAYLADKLYHSLHDKLLKLPDYCEVYPAHGAGSLCGRSMGAKWLTTIGYERRYNAALQIKKKEVFVQSLTTNMPPAPDHFSRCSDINRRGPKLVSNLPVLEKLKPTQFKERMLDPGVAVVDVRGYMDFAGLHIQRAWHLDLNGNFPTFAGWIIPPDRDILLVSNDYEDALNAKMWAQRVGLDRFVGFLEGGMTSWATVGEKSTDIHLFSAEELHERITRSSNVVLIDVRAPAEYGDSHIEGAVNIPAPDLRSRYTELDPEKPVTLICSSGNRSSLAASILKQEGFREVHNVAGGMKGYSAAGYVKECAVCENPHGSRYSNVS
jgi:glyoxylase-like metal-dependent hydrolase (beta-lactamase superfamily II)/rhodanese-related sulfurtransferase